MRRKHARQARKAATGCAVPLVSPSRSNCAVNEEQTAAMFGRFVATFLAVFLAELPDKTMVARSF